MSVSLWTGALCPFIIFESADIDSAVDEVIDTAFKKKKEVMHAVKYLLLEDEMQHLSCHPQKNIFFPFLLSGPLVVVCAGECVGPCCGPSKAAYGRDEVCCPAQ